MVAFQISESGLFELFLLKSVEKAFFIDYFSLTGKPDAKEKCIDVCCNKPLKVVVR